MKGYFVIIAVIAAIVLSLVTLSVLFQRTLQMETAEQFNKQQLLLANAGASGIQDYLGLVKEDALRIARTVSQFRVRTEAQFRFVADGVFREKDTVKKRIEFLDRRGEVLFTRGNVHAEGPDEKAAVKKAAGLCPATALIEQDANTLTVIAPACRLDTFTGAVLITMNIQDVAREFLGSLKSGARENAWMMDEKGNLLYHPTQPAMVGRNLHKTDASCFKCHKTFDVEKKIVEGRGDYCSGDYYGRYVAPTGEDKILAYSSAMAGNTRWIIAVSAPYSQVTLSIKRSMNFYVWLIVLIAVTTSGVSHGSSF